MTNDVSNNPTNRIKDKIHLIREQQVILDEDLAELYNVNTKVLNQAVKRNIERFPERFMFQLTEKEYENLISQIVISKAKRETSEAESLRSQIVTLKKGRGIHRKYIPYAFTESGVAMLSGVLKSEIAIKISIQIIDAFIAMRKFITENADVFYRLDSVEQKQLTHDKNFKEIFDAIQNKKLLPDKGIFFEGQIFDAYKFVSNIIKSAYKSIILVDNYVDDSVLTLLAKRKKNIKTIIFTKEISKQLTLDLEKYNSQYPKIEIQTFKNSHDRFLIIDEKEIYHIGASLKDLGKKWFAFSKFDKETINILKRLKK